MLRLRGHRLAVAHAPEVELHAADVDPVAVACAGRNVSGVGGHAHAGDLYDALPTSLRGRVDTLVVNAPYVPSAAIALMPPEARDFEPLWPSTAGRTAWTSRRRVAAAAPQWLVPGGWLLIESSERQAPVLAEIFAAAGLAPAVTTADGDVDATVVLGRLPAG